MVAEPLIPGDNGAGIELLFPSVMCAGVFMLLIWLLEADRFITLMAASIMDGFCCGLAIVIGLSQLHPFQIGHGTHKSWRPADDPTTYAQKPLLFFLHAYPPRNVHTNKINNKPRVSSSRRCAPPAIIQPSQYIRGFTLPQAGRCFGRAQRGRSEAGMRCATS